MLLWFGGQEVSLQVVIVQRKGGTVKLLGVRGQVKWLGTAAQQVPTFPLLSFGLRYLRRPPLILSGRTSSARSLRIGFVRAPAATGTFSGAIEVKNPLMSTFQPRQLNVV